MGTPVALMDLHASVNGMTVALYWYSGEFSAQADGTYGLIGQGALPTQGWAMTLIKSVTIGVFRFGVADGGGTFRNVFILLDPVTDDTWYFLWSRREADPGGDGDIRISVNAGTESSLAVTGSTTSANPFKIGTLAGASDMFGGGCYAQVWNADRGARLSVPTKPDPVSGDTADRWVFGEGKGTVLAGDNGNDGAITDAEWSEVVPDDWSLQ